MTSKYGGAQFMDGAPTLGAYYPREVGPAETLCPACDGIAIVVWRDDGIFHQRTECTCGRKTRWVVCGHDAHADTTDDEATIRQARAEDMRTGNTDG